MMARIVCEAERTIDVQNGGKRRRHDGAHLSIAETICEGYGARG